MEKNETDCGQRREWTGRLEDLGQQLVASEVNDARRRASLGMAEAQRKADGLRTLQIAWAGGDTV